MSNQKDPNNQPGYTITDEDRRLAALADAPAGGSIDTLMGLKNAMVRRVQSETTINCNPATNAHRLCCAVAVLIENNRSLVGPKLLDLLIKLPAGYLGDIEGKNKQAMQVEHDDVKAKVQKQVDEAMAGAKAELAKINQQLQSARGIKAEVREELENEMVEAREALDDKVSRFMREKAEFEAYATKTMDTIRSKMAELKGK
jgi:hypothetical protein